MAAKRSSALVRPSPNVANLKRRVWLLLLLDGAERAGVVPISKLRLHRLAYLADTLSPLYDLPVPDGRIVKYKRGPYYPDVQRDVDRLSVQYLVKVFSLTHRQDEFGWWLDAEYGLTRAGMTLVAKAVSLPDIRDIHGFLCEVATAYSGIQGDEALDDIALQDVNFHNPSQGFNTLIDFSDPERNLTLQTTASMQRIPPGSALLPERDRLHLYFRYLERFLAKAATH